MRKPCALIFISASLVVANQIGLLPAQQPVDPAALLDGDPNQFDASNLQVIHDSMVGLKPSVDKNEMVQPGFEIEHDEPLAEKSFPPPHDAKPEHQKDQEASQRQQNQENGKQEQATDTIPQEQPASVPAHHSPHRVRHHTHTRQSDRYAQRRQRELRRRRKESEAPDQWKSWQTANEWSVDAASRTIYPDRTDLPAPTGTAARTRTLVNAGAGAEADPIPQSESFSMSSSTVSPAPNEQWNSGIKKMIKGHEEVKSEEDLIAFNLAQSETRSNAESSLDLGSVGGSLHESVLEGGSSNTRYDIGDRLVFASGASPTCSRDMLMARVWFLMAVTGVMMALSAYC